ncbi:MAG: SAM-dependent chlorinase/fluorinase [Bacteroidales bacterium]|nr:SAM-dependent chlorinase/fluorinase [Bacteroidales bacterium]MBQ7488967.1 SAM-dependent chlorinase/fluorinase [Bacteroidales bacterium]
MKNITLISDWKLRDPYIAIFKGLILKELGDVNFIDISHAIPLCDIKQTAFILKGSYLSFPDDTLHVILTGAVNNPDLMPVCVKYGKHIFIGADNGIFSLLLESDENFTAHIYDENIPSESFIERIIKMIKWHFSGEIEKHTKPYEDLRFVLSKMPEINPTAGTLTGHIAYIDSFCNAVTDIPVAMFKEFVGKRQFQATVSASQYITISKYSDFYKNCGNEVYFVANQFGFLEITMFRAHIAVLGNIQIGDEVVVAPLGLEPRTP